MDWRFLKTNDERLQDTLAYIGANLSTTNANEVATDVQALSPAQQKNLGGAISLGATGTKDERTANREARRAKRALMLVTSLYPSDANKKRLEMQRTPPRLFGRLSRWTSGERAARDIVAGRVPRIRGRRNPRAI
jgi:hypothetical protein